MLLGAAAAALFALVAGCASEARRADEEKARAFAREMARTRAAAVSLAAEISHEADRLAEARRAARGEYRNEAAIDASVERLQLGHALLEAIEDAELTFALASRFYTVREAFEFPKEVVERLEAVVGKMVEVGRAVGERPAEYALIRRTAGAPARGDIHDRARADRLGKDIERDRAMLKAYRTEIALVTQPAAR